MKWTFALVLLAVLTNWFSWGVAIILSRRTRSAPPGSRLPKFSPLSLYWPPRFFQWLNEVNEVALGREELKEEARLALMAKRFHIASLVLIAWAIAALFLQ